MYRNTYVNINLDNIEHNVRKFIKDNDKYKYYFGVVNADSYGHYDNEVVNSIIEGGCNYLAVSSLDEAIAIRKYNKEIPILCLGIIDKKYIAELKKLVVNGEAIKNNQKNIDKTLLMW